MDKNRDEYIKRYFCISKKHTRRMISFISLTLAALWFFTLSVPQAMAATQWVGTWSTSPDIEGAPFTNVTLRQIVHISIGGQQVRVRFSNKLGTDPLLISAASIGVQDADDTVIPSTLQTLTFGGESSVTIPAGAVVLTDPVGLTVYDEENLAISLYVSGLTGASTAHTFANQTSYIALGNQTALSGLLAPVSTNSWFWLSGVEVLKTDRAGAVVALGDSITDGLGSTSNENNRYTDFLARRLLDASVGVNQKKMAVLNEGIAGNRVLTDGLGQSAMARLDSDVLTQSGVTHIILLEGLNDIGFSALEGGGVTADEIIAMYKQIILRAHAMGIKVIIGTLTPYKGYIYYTAEGNEKRNLINQWIRETDLHDGYVDFDMAVRDSSDPLRLYPAYDSGDHGHPSDEGYEAMAAAVDLDLPGAGTRTNWLEWFLSRFPNR